MQDTNGNLLVINMNNCPRCNKTDCVVETTIALLNPTVESNKKFYEKVFQCKVCNALYQHIFWKDTWRAHIACYVSGIAFLYQRKNGEWYY